MREHARLSEEIIGRIAVLADIAPIAGAHHERLDGQGYLKRLSGERICLETRIITAADIFDALTARRPYRDALPRQRALAIMEEGRGRIIDGDCLDALTAALPKIGDL
ncbi:MAG: HD-GYP domain-containing protein [Acidiferrobacter sp.]